MSSINISRKTVSISAVPYEINDYSDYLKNVELSYFERDSLKFRIISELFQNYAQSLWDPRTTKDEMIDILYKTDPYSKSATDIQLINEYCNILSNSCYFDDGFIDYLKMFQKPLADLFLNVYQGSVDWFVAQAQIDSFDELKDLATGEDGFVGKFK
ncbi:MULTISPECIES: hypothetical protein [unclassified Breznakia]|uniref:hypothetical protein n=1 Tax=unclassified Breznakia TaxID=2623764 RepID=UPI0024767420|nr:MULTISPECIES: hypothetical protein [unclassified Breznakia]MDH6367402.1 hypothetical protein [Breznakia sp. PH1-1]MDH6403934.1 hypothetical protein [Breznakia sp. PF1-11]MDH6411643.1 hypothetical protein [Breznakia sp. PFB1-11]MDH6414569.1 hypothetical protein [Breznakia sp. PFB1-14]MDH6418675.1 hypothetical protein [Breznakia sp. PFB1-12]